MHLGLTQQVHWLDFNKGIVLKKVAYFYSMYQRIFQELLKCGTGITSTSEFCASTRLLLLIVEN
jgi:altronate dehydratase